MKQYKGIVNLPKEYKQVWEMTKKSYMISKKHNENRSFTTNIENTPITIIIDQKPDLNAGKGQWDGPYAGQWDNEKYEITIFPATMMRGDWGNDEGYKLECEMQELKLTLHHELRHAMQTLLNRNIHKTKGYDQYGYSKKSKVWKLKHSLRDIEFHPKLGDEITRYIELAALRKKIANRIPIISAFINHSDFFKDLKDSFPVKWKEAVKKFIINIPKEYEYENYTATKIL